MFSKCDTLKEEELKQLYQNIDFDDEKMINISKRFNIRREVLLDTVLYLASQNNLKYTKDNFLM